MVDLVLVLIWITCDLVLVDYRYLFAVGYLLLAVSVGAFVVCYFGVCLLLFGLLLLLNLGLVAFWMSLYFRWT